MKSKLAELHKRLKRLRRRRQRLRWGTAYAAVVREISHRTAYCDILETLPRLHEPLAEVTLGVGLLKQGANFDFIIEKATELGVSRIVPLLTERTVRKHGREERWEHLALAAMRRPFDEA